MVFVLPVNRHRSRRGHILTVAILSELRNCLVRVLFPVVSFQLSVSQVLTGTRNGAAGELLRFNSEV